ncbi:phosphoribosylformylglycinamidine cyclo-ligase [Cyanobacterium stanieri LEGE 03274]|uniref:Phosphoribosylformylglycinamidine cyclo-ligase n=1 Tax=Cyanobacterium stanieri LEGE 03274 TaxID=1828756 RepID=A0ABR9V3M1_9CHRO|nr:phosphoribosylformylglycinamidine cyclo-ligase [Cyanobacterium stanieri]MBE9222473.1 phosphoribosylformylglycinamidine cyclo-ligase [Cyanobacterium stanieri LEGE 03274]
MDYKQAGVDIEAGREFVNKIGSAVESTYRPGVLGGLGGFGGCFEIPSGYRQPVLISGTDGVGTKLKIAHQLNRHDTVGIDLVAMCVNDILTSGAEPLFFLDYLATGKLNPQQLQEVVVGIAQGCKESGCALLGGETAEMPGFYQVGEYDLAGFCVGIVEKSSILDGKNVQIGDQAIALSSSGIHSNGFSLVRKIIEVNQLNWEDKPKELGGLTLGETCLTPTRIYVKPILKALENHLGIKAMAHITGGGIPENLPRCLPDNLSIEVNLNNWQIPPIFQWLAKTGNVNQQDMLDTFNMGVGFVVIVPPHKVKETIAFFEGENISSYHIGKVIEGKKDIQFVC